MSVKKKLAVKRQFLSFSNMEESSRLSESYDYLFKFLVIGSAGTGKSCLLHQFIEGRFKEDSSHTIGVEFGSKIVPVGGKTVKLQIWDTAGKDFFLSTGIRLHQSHPIIESGNP